MLREINDFLEWEPHNLFFTCTNYTWTPMSDGDIEMINSGGSNTKIEKALNRIPSFWYGLIKVIYYVISWPLYLIIKIPWMFFKAIFIPQKYFE